MDHRNLDLKSAPGFTVPAIVRKDWDLKMSLQTSETCSCEEEEGKNQIKNVSLWWLLKQRSLPSSDLISRLLDIDVLTVSELLSLPRRDILTLQTLFQKAKSVSGLQRESHFPLQLLTVCSVTCRLWRMRHLCLWENPLWCALNFLRPCTSAHFCHLHTSRMIACLRWRERPCCGTARPPGESRLPSTCHLHHLCRCAQPSFV